MVEALLLGLLLVELAVLSGFGAWIVPAGAGIPAWFALTAWLGFPLLLLGGPPACQWAFRCARLAPPLLGLGRGTLGGLLLATPALAMSLIFYPLLADVGDGTSPLRWVRSNVGTREPIAVLGVEPLRLRYFAGLQPEHLVSAADGQRWLTVAANGPRRWLVTTAALLPELNSEHRLATGDAEAEDKGDAGVLPVSGSRNLPCVLDWGRSTVVVVSQPLPGLACGTSLDAWVRSRPPPAGHVSEVAWEGGLRLVGWDTTSLDGQLLPTSIERGRVWQLRLHLLAAGPLEGDWRVFVHLDPLGADRGGKRQNADHPILRGRYPTRNWRAGDYCTDIHEVVVDRTFPPGRYQISVGLFRGAERLRVSTGSHHENRVPLGTLEVR